jgi:hypothetical protein
LSFPPFTFGDAMLVAVLVGTNAASALLGWYSTRRPRPAGGYAAYCPVDGEEYREMDAAGLLAWAARHERQHAAAATEHRSEGNA